MPQASSVAAAAIASALPCRAPRRADWLANFAPCKFRLVALRQFGEAAEVLGNSLIGHRMVLSVTLALVGLLPRATPGRTRTGRSAVSRSGLLRLEEPSPHANLVLLRHGQSEWNLANRFTGWVDVDLTERGITEAREAGRLLAAEGLDLDECYCSSLRRAIRTSCLALSGMDQCWVPLHKDARLNEQHSGFLTGNNKRALAEEHGVEQVMAWRRKYDEPPPPMPNDSPLQQMMVKDERYAVRRAPDTDPSPSPQPQPPAPTSASLPRTPRRCTMSPCPRPSAYAIRACLTLTLTLTLTLKHPEP